MPREDITRPARKSRLQQARLRGETRLARARLRCAGPARLSLREALSRLRSALVIAYWDEDGAWELVAEAYVIVEESREVS
jgi:hypothetical protein